MILWPSARQVVALHDRLVAATGGAGGLRDPGLLDSALHRPLAAYGEVELYADLMAKVAALVEALILDHPFVDGNKRTAMATGIAVLKLNGMSPSAAPQEIEDAAVAVAERRMPLADLIRWFRSHAAGSP